jgi:hypothetical protein
MVDGHAETMGASEVDAHNSLDEADRVGAIPYRTL